jgi:hypothetical protein
LGSLAGVKGHDMQRLMLALLLGAATGVSCKDDGTTFTFDAGSGSGGSTDAAHSGGGGSSGADSGGDAQSAADGADDTGHVTEEKR